MVTEWITSCNPRWYDGINAFRDLKKIDWRQSTNVAVGDIVYVYVSADVQAIRMKCRVNKIDIATPDIDDSKYCLTDYEENFEIQRYMELELIEELDGELYTRKAMERHGFKSPQKAVKVTSELKEYLDLVWKLKNAEEMEPDLHDGSYELVRETVNAYANMDTLDGVDYRDLNLVYLMTVGTWKQKIPSKKNTVNDSNLPNNEKRRLTELLDYVQSRAENREYENREKDTASIGMFGTGFFTFYGKTDDVSPRNFIQMCIDIKDSTDEEYIFNRCEQTLNERFHGMKAASASMVLHCLKPTIFPVFNSNMGADNIYVYFGADLKWKTEIYTYIKNARKVKEFRDRNFSIKNYRIFDMAAWDIRKNDSDTYPDEEPEFVDDLWQAENVDIEIENEENNEKFDKNIILYGPPGTGKTYNTAIYAVAICDGVSLEEIRLKPYKEVMERYRQLDNAEKRITFTTFHQSYGYEDFIEGIRPKLDGGNEIEYVINDGVFKTFCNYAGQTEKPCVFIIDEINRGNISKIFGELITLIEDTKREGMEEGVFATLPYSSEKFSVPKNVYIIGTMNTADRSIALMDTALRRRFKFEEMLPDTQVLRDLHADKVVDGEMELDVVEMLETINRRITYLYDREHTIGHAFFTGLKNEPTVSRLSEIFKKSVIPLLQEYFYGDYSKIMLVLGDNGKSVDEHKFILAKEINAGAVFKGDCSDLDIPDYSYEIQETAFDDILSYIEIMN